MENTIYKNKLILDIRWANTLKGSFGIIKVKDIITNKEKTLIGIITELSEEENVKAILDFGFTF